MIEETYADFLVRLLPVPASLDDSHDDVLGGHERQLLRDAPGNHLWVHDEALRDVLQRREHDIRSQECLRKGDPPIRAVVKRTFKPLHAGRVQGVLLQSHEVSGETADPL